jgi:hypothetical protein
MAHQLLAIGLGLCDRLLYAWPDGSWDSLVARVLLRVTMALRPTPRLLHRSRLRPRRRLIHPTVARAGARQSGH